MFFSSPLTFLRIPFSFFPYLQHSFFPFSPDKVEQQSCEHKEKEKKRLTMFYFNCCHYSYSYHPLYLREFPCPVSHSFFLLFFLFLSFLSFTLSFLAVSFSLCVELLSLSPFLFLTLPIFFSHSLFL